MQNLYLNPFYHKKVLLSALCLLSLCLASVAQKYPVDTIVMNGPRNNRINFVYLSDGYTKGQLSRFITDAGNINSELFSQTPFAEYKSFFNEFEISVPSAESGAIHPGTAADEGSSGGQPVANPNNYFQSTFDYYSIHRLLVPQNNGGLNTVLINNFPDYDQGFIIVNSPFYGGSGGAYATASTDASSAEVAIHEIGHSFAGLADEYWAGDFYAAEKPNMTQNNNPATVKWKRWMGINDIGIYPYGASGTPSVWYKPHQACKMQVLGFPFCSVCTERLIDRMHELVNMVDSYLPASNAFVLNNTNNITFSVDHVQNKPKTIKVKWYINKATNPTPYAQNVKSISVPYTAFTSGVNTVTAEVIDSVGISKSYMPSAGYINTVEWSVTNSVLPVVLKDFRGKVDTKGNSLLDWEVATPDQAQSFTVEKSKDAVHFSKVAVVPATQNTRLYSYTDFGLFTPYTYYRLAMKDKDGKTNYSNVIRLSPIQESALYKVYQDAAGRNYHLSCSVPANASVTLTVTTASGARILSKAFSSTGTQLDYDFDLHNKAAGVYFANIIINGTQHIIKLIAN